MHLQSATLSFDDDDAAATATAALPSTPTSTRPRVRAVASTPLQAAPTAKRVRVQAPTVSTIKTYEAFNKKGEKCPWDTPPVHLKTTAAPKGKYTLNLCNECNTECRDVARGKWVCMNNHTSDVESTPEEKLPYQSWGRVQAMACTDTEEERVLVTMNHDAAEAVFGPFGPEHMDPNFFTSGVRFACNLYWPKPGNGFHPFATRCERL